ncbi:hypothetical protein FQA39_LY06987 [Lamprigera yunnana]|nr:hypothetical protein FQA39_LY06987 [Lamprigera yunnana]
MKDTDKEWRNLAPIDFNNQNPVEIKNLSILTKYYIRGILLLDNGIGYELDLVPNTTASTSCKFVSYDDVDIKTSNISAILTFQNNDESCRSIDYRLWINNKIGKTSETYNFEIFGLNPFSYYNVTIRNVVINNTLNVSFTTAEGVSSRVRNIQSEEGATTITVSWSNPQTPNGIIKYYLVSYSHLTYRACNQTRIGNSEVQKNLIVYITFVVLENMIPYSEYSIEIVPFTITEGESTNVTVFTNSTDSPESNEIPTINNGVADSTSVSIFMKPPNCTLVRGPLVVYATVQCSNAWCPNESHRFNFTSFNYNNPLVVRGVFPYSDYDISINVGRNLQNILQEPNMNLKISTLAAVPHVIKDIVVFSKNESSISVRFPLPYPPTGVIVEYSVEYCYERSWRSAYCEKTIIVPAEPCILWRSFHCITLYKLYQDYTYTLAISARNNGTEFNQPSTVSERTVQQPPNPIQNVTAEWDDHYNLTLKWAHPSITNGPLISFSFEISSQKGYCLDTLYPVNEETYQLWYTYTVQISESCYSNKLKIYGRANNIYKGSIISYEIYSPPVTPTFQNNPKISQVTNTTVSVDFSELINFEIESLMYVLLSTTTQKDVSEEYVQDLWDKSGLPANSLSWIAAEYDYKSLNNSQKIIILGSGVKFQSIHLQREIYNRPLTPVTEYTISILLINKFQDLTRHFVHKIYVTTSGTKPENLQSQLNTPLFALLLLLVIPLFLWLIIRKYRKNKKINWSTLVTMVNSGAPSVSENDVIPLTTDERKMSTPNMIVVPPKRKITIPIYFRYWL